MRWKVVKIDLACITVMVIIFALIIISIDLPLIVKAFQIPICLVWIGIALRVWHGSDRSSKVEYWLKESLMTIFVALTWLVLFRLLSCVFLGDDEPTSSLVFDFGTTAILCPGMTLVYLLGWVRDKWLNLDKAN